MTTRTGVLLAMLLHGCASMTSPPQGGLTTEGTDFTVRAYPDARRGPAAVEGYVYNKRSWRATHVLLRVESLDAAGAVLATGVRPLDRDVPLGDRVYFQVPAPVAAPAYRVSVEYVFWRDRCGG